MAASLVGQYQITTFTSPVNGTTPIDANQVRGNDNTIKTAYDSHDSDATIHFQDSLAASRPAASIVGRKWLDNDTYRVYYDDGSNWHEIAYASTSGGSFTGPILLADGTVSAPGLAFTNDPDCGLYRIGTNNVGFSLNGAKVLDLSTTGLGVTGILSAISATLTPASATTPGVTINNNNGSGAQYYAEFKAGATVIGRLYRPASSNDIRLDPLTGSFTIGGPLGVTGQFTALSDLAVVGNTAINGSLAAGASTLGSLTVTTSASITGTISADSGSQIRGSGVFILGIASGNAGSALQLRGWQTGNKNWQIDTALIGSDLNFTPSIAVGGTTFTTPAASLTSTGTFTTTTVVAAITGNVTGNVSGSAATVTSASQTAITTIANLVTVGALNSGSITSGFGSIDVGADAISGGTITGTSLVGPLTGTVDVGTGTGAAGRIYKTATNGTIIRLAAGSLTDFAILDSSGSSIATVLTGAPNIRFEGNITTPGSVNGDTVTAVTSATSAHFVGSGSAPSVTTPVAGASVSVAGNDTSGIVTLTLGGGGFTGPGNIFTLTFAANYANAPIPMVIPATGQTVYIPSGPNVNNFTVACKDNMTASLTTYYYYHVIGK